MFRFRLPKIVGITLSKNCFTFRQCSTNSLVHQPTIISPYKINNVSIAGRVTQIFKGENVVKFFLTSMGGPENKFKITHKAMVTRRNDSLFQSAGTKLGVDQYVSLEGKLNSSQFRTIDGRIRSVLETNVTELYMSDSSDDLSKQSLNSVELLGLVKNDIYSGNNFKTFALSVVKNARADQPKLKEAVDFPVFAYDPELFSLLNSIEKGTFGVFVRGFLNYKNNKSDSGRMVTSGYITAKQIHRIKFS